jgi:adenosine kinase
MQFAHRSVVPDDGSITLGIVAPDGRDAMLQHAEQMSAAGIPFVFDPGQGLPMFDGAELQRFVRRATWVAVNDYEGRMLCERIGTTLAELSRSHLRGIIVTLGADGCEVWEQGRRQPVPGVPAREVVDPTGCGDAFRGALLYGLDRGWPLARCAELGNRLGAVKIAHRGGQNHAIDRAALGLD